MEQVMRYIPSDRLNKVVDELPIISVDPRVMKLILGKQYQQRTEDWYEKRKSILTASDSATVIGHNDYSTRDVLLGRKAGVIPPSTDFDNNPAIEHGVKYEDEAADIYMCQNPHLAPFFEIGLVMHDVHHFLGASPDRVTANGILIEIKCPYLRTIVPGQVPKHYMPQLQFSMEVLNLEVAHFVQYRPYKSIFEPMELDVTIVDRDRSWFQNFLPQFQGFIHDLEYIKANPDMFKLNIKKGRVKTERSPNQKKRKFDSFLIENEETIANDNFQKRCMILDNL